MPKKNYDFPNTTMCFSFSIVCDSICKTIAPEYQLHRVIDLLEIFCKKKCV